MRNRVPRRATIAGRSPAGRSIHLVDVPADFPGSEPPSEPDVAAGSRRRPRRAAPGLATLSNGATSKAPPLLCCHGFWDHARSFATLAPLLTSRFRVLALDARGHGDSDWAGAYTWHSSIHAIADVIRAIGRPVHLLGHSMGGGHVTDTTRAVPELVRRVINIDGFGPPPLTPAEDANLLGRCAMFLDGRRGAARRPDWRPYGEFNQLVERRQAQNPRLAPDWLRYFVFHAARRGEDGWRWEGRSAARARLRPVAARLDRARLRAGHPSDVGDRRLRGRHLGADAGGDRRPAPRRRADARARDRRRCRALRPHGAARRHGATGPRLPRRLMHIHHARTAIALHELSHGDGLPLLLLHALGESSAGWGELPALWPGQVLAVDFSGHGESEPLRGGGYWPELLRRRRHRPRAARRSRGDRRRASAPISRCSSPAPARNRCRRRCCSPAAASPAAARSTSTDRFSPP